MQRCSPANRAGKSGSYGVVLIFSAILSNNLLADEIKSQEEMQEALVEGIRIRGNAELPKVLYVVPWRSSAGRFFFDPESVEEIDVFDGYLDKSHEANKRQLREKLKLYTPDFSDY